MPEPTPPAEQPTEAAPADLAKLTKAELVERLAFADAERERMSEERALDRDRRRARPEDAMVVSALLDLHRTVEAKAESTIRGRSPSIGNRYLEAARALGDELVVAILGPAKG